MKTLLALLLSAVSLAAADRLSRIGLDYTPQNYRTTDGYPAKPTDPIRIIDGKPVDLRPLFGWIAAGNRTPPKTDYKVKSPMPAWERVSGEVVQIVSAGVLLRRGETYLLLKRHPQVDTLVDGSPVLVVAVVSGTFRYTSANGVARTISAYDYGALPTPEEQAELNRKAAEAVAAQRAAVKADLDKKLAAAKERAEKARAEREKKP